MTKNFKEILTEIEAFVFDVDGVFTDCTIMPTLDGDLLRSYNVKDGLAVVRAIKKGYHIAIISGSRGKQLEQRMESLGVRYIYLEKKHKLDSLNDFSAQCGLGLDKMLYVGDDVPDIAPMKAVRLGVAPADAIDEIRAVAHYTSAFNGGGGVVRDVIEQVLRARGDWYEI